MRVFDVAVSMVALVLTAPLMAMAALAIRLESRGPVFFKQRRIGEGGMPFDIIKLRTMCVGADEMKADLLELNESDGPLFKMKSDPRITRVGRILRKFSIDELPQFWNVMRGEMSSEMVAVSTCLICSMVCLLSVSSSESVAWPFSVR